MTDTAAWGYGLATISADGTVLDTWFPAPAARAHCRPAATATSRRPSSRLCWARTNAATSGSTSSRWRSRWPRLPPSTADAYLRLHLSATCSCSPTRSTWTASSACCPPSSGPTPDRFTRTISTGSRPLLQRAGISAHGHRQVPAAARLRRPRPRVRIADASRVRLGAYLAARHDRHARGLRQLQRRHARRLDGRGTHLAGRRRRRRHGHRRRRIDHGHAVAAAAPSASRSASGRCSARTRASASRSATTASSRRGCT